MHPPPLQDLRSSYYKDYVQKILKKPNKIRYKEPGLSCFQLVDNIGCC